MREHGLREIAVIGTGYVGLVSGTCFAEIGQRVTCCDIDQHKIEQLNVGNVAIYEPGLQELVQRNVQEKRLSFTCDVQAAIRSAEIIYIAVGTPMLASGEADLQYVQAVAKTIGQSIEGYKVIVNKSTVPIGTGAMIAEIIAQEIRVRASRIDDSAKWEQPNIDVVSNPEFLREGSAVQDCMNMERAIIGATSEKAAQIIAKLHEPFQTKLVLTDVQTAEMIKYAANAFLATKISFINDIATICEAFEADVGKVAEGIGLDHRIGLANLKAGLGYGGSCFPKDVQALIHMADQAGYDFQLMKAVEQTNQGQRKRMIAKLQAALGTDLHERTIAVLGLAFKPNTNDMREAPCLSIIPELISLGAKVQAYDPVSVPVAPEYLGHSQQVSYFTDVYRAIENCHGAFILTDWQQIKTMDVSLIQKKMAIPLLVDGRNCFDLDHMREHGLIYHSMGRPVVQP